jgi:signal peptidase I
MTTEDGRRAADLPVEPSAAATGTQPAPPAADLPVDAVRTRRPAKRKSFLRELPGIVITALVISVLIKTFLVQAFYIPSGSMENTLLVNDRVLVNKLADKPDEIHRGDVDRVPRPGRLADGGRAASRGGACRTRSATALVFVGLAPAAGEEDLIKRVIGVGGDKVACCDDQGRLTVNGGPLDETYRLPRRRAVRRELLGHRAQGRAVGHGRPPVGLRGQPGPPAAAGKGFVPVDDVIGRAFTIVWPLDRARCCSRPPRSPARLGRVRRGEPRPSS